WSRSIESVTVGPSTGWAVRTTRTSHSQVASRASFKCGSVTATSDARTSRLASTVGHPRTARICSDPGQMHAPAGKLDEEQDVEAFQEECVNGGEVALEDARP